MPNHVSGTNDWPEAMEKLGYIRLSSPWLLSVIPALAYIIAYLNRLGEAFARGIPGDWISVSLTDALSRASAVVLVVGIAIAIARTGSQWTLKLPLWARRAATRGLDQLGPAILYGFILGSLPLVLIFVVASLLLIAGTATRDFLQRESLPSVPQSRTEGVVLLNRTEPGDFGDVQVRARLVLAAVILSLFLAPLVGWSRAIMPRTILVTLDNTQIVAASYGSTVVLADLSVEPDGSWRVGDTRSIVTLGQGADQKFVRRRGPISLQW